MGGVRRSAVAAAALAVVLTACASATEEAIERATGSEVDVDGASVRVENDEGSFTVNSGGDLPDGFPDSVVLPTGYSVFTASQQELQGEVGFILIGSVAAPPEEVATELENAYEMEPSQSSQFGDVVSLEYADVDGIKVGYTIAKNADGDSAVTIAANPIID
jgi:hypothetical protein